MVGTEKSQNGQFLKRLLQQRDVVILLGIEVKGRKRFKGTVVRLRLTCVRYAAPCSKYIRDGTIKYS